MTTKLPMQPCLGCGHKMDLHSQLVECGLPDASPRPGDAALCIRCGCIMVYRKNLSFRMPTLAEIALFEKDERVQFGVKVIDQMHGRRPT